MGDTPNTAQVVYEQAQRAISWQVTSLTELRTRTATVLAASGLISGFFGQAALPGGVGAAGVFAILGLVVTAGLCVVVLIPRHDAWWFSLDPTVLIEDHLDVPERNDPTKLYRFLATSLDAHYLRNKPNLDKLYTYFWCACVALSIDVGLWLLELVT